MTSNVRSLSLFVGTGECNGNCKHCAGRIHRGYAPKEDGIIDSSLIEKTLRECYSQGARSLSISSSGEPTLSPLSVTKTLELVDSLKEDGIAYSPINLYSNGIRIGKDLIFCDDYLLRWNDLGLKWIYITVHNTNEKKNAEIYGVKEYPSLKVIVNRIHYNDIFVRANIVLSKENIGTLERFVETVNNLREIGFNAISAWPIRNEDDQLDEKSCPDVEGLDKIADWIEKNQSDKCKLRILTEKHRELYVTGQKLTLFPSGKLSNSWCN
jgi:molybdenum cofactor biosynthesis enzyme MoaA